MEALNLFGLPVWSEHIASILTLTLWVVLIYLSAVVLGKLLDRGRRVLDGLKTRRNSSRPARPLTSILKPKKVKVTRRDGLKLDSKCMLCGGPLGNKFYLCRRKHRYCRTCASAVGFECPGDLSPLKISTLT